jgi:D-amino-acid oxidase
MSERSRSTAAVIGTGVIGVTTALEAQRQGIKDVTLYSDKLPQFTVSTKAGAVFEPYQPGEMSVETMQQFVRVGLQKYQNIIDQHPESETGIRTHDLISASTGIIKPEEVPFLPAIPHWQEIPKEEIPGNYQSALLLEVPFIDPTIALPWLIEQFIQNGGKINAPIETITDLKEFIEGTPEDLVFNCSGLGARDLLNDSQIIPMRGQIIVTSYTPKHRWSILGDDGFYVFPRQNETILGGTTELGEWKEETTPAAIQRIFEHAQIIIPELQWEHVTRTYAGLRPFRTNGVRLESEQVGDKTHIINVGFGGSGWTFCWGAAEEAVNLATNGPANGFV